MSVCMHFSQRHRAIPQSVLRQGGWSVCGAPRKVIYVFVFLSIHFSD